MFGRDKPYHRLPGTGRQVQLIIRLWQGPDHLLLIESTGFSERYKRFYYRDIQAVILRKTDRGKTINLVMASLAGLCALTALSAGSVWSIFCSVMGGLFFLFLIVNSLLGPTCACHLRTAVQTEELRSLNRLRLARKVLRRLKPLLETAQGTAAANDLPKPISESGSAAAEPGAIQA